jgi:hypothetical protein
MWACEGQKRGHAVNVCGDTSVTEEADARSIEHIYVIHDMTGQSNRADPPQSAMRQLETIANSRR